MKKLNSVMFFNNGNVCAFFGDEQVPGLQGNVITQWAEKADAMGYDVDGQVIETPQGNWRLFKCSDGGFNLEAWNRNPCRA